MYSINCVITDLIQVSYLIPVTPDIQKGKTTELWLSAKDTLGNPRRNRNTNDRW